jgi:hypothetical protein
MISNEKVVHYKVVQLFEIQDFLFYSFSIRGCLKILQCEIKVSHHNMHERMSLWNLLELLFGSAQIF